MRHSKGIADQNCRAIVSTSTATLVLLNTTIPENLASIALTINVTLRPPSHPTHQINFLPITGNPSAMDQPMALKRSSRSHPALERALPTPQNGYHGRTLRLDEDEASGMLADLKTWLSF